MLHGCITATLIPCIRKEEGTIERVLLVKVYFDDNVAEWAAVHRDIDQTGLHHLAMETHRALFKSKTT